jgi:hypothetical protein
MPPLPSKFTQTQEGARVPGEEMLVELTEYLQRLFELSPLICNLVSVRCFLTCMVKDQLKGSSFDKDLSDFNKNFDQSLE